MAMKTPISRLGCGLMFYTLALAAAHGAVNNCADPYWSDTLRCKAHPALQPQPVPPAPTLASELRDYTRVNLTLDLDIRCADGTRPVIYVDPAAGGPSSKWLISLTGGGSCAAEDRDQNGSFENGQACVDQYANPGEASEMGTFDKPIMKNLGGSGAESSGILKPDVARNPVFARFNRVRIEKCSYDRYNGLATHPGIAALTPGNMAFSYTLFHHGQKIVFMALESLRGAGAGNAGLSYTSFVANGAGVNPINVVLPSIEDATKIVFVGHSGAAHGLYHNIDRIGDYLRQWSGFNGDLRVIHDAQFLPAAENEAAFDAANPSALFAQDYVGISPDLGAYDASVHYSNSIYTEQYRAWMNPSNPTLGSIFDASCVAAHALSGDVYKCRDRFHVRLHHETTPALVREDFSDPNFEHSNGDVGHIVFWGPYGVFPHCAAYGATPCPPILPAGPGSPYRARLSTQAASFLTAYATQSELVTGGDQSGALPTAYLWMPNCGAHESTYDDVQFYSTRLINGSSEITLREFAEQFVAAAPSGVNVGHVDGLNGDRAECGPALLRDSFE